MADLEKLMRDIAWRAAKCDDLVLVQTVRALHIAIGQRNTEVEHSHAPAAVIQEAKEMYDEELLNVLKGIA